MGIQESCLTLKKSFFFPKKNHFLTVVEVSDKLLLRFEVAFHGRFVIVVHASCW